MPYIYKFSDFRTRVNLFHSFFLKCFCYALRARGIPFPHCAGPGSLPLLPGPSSFLLRLSDLVCSLLVSRKEKSYVAEVQEQF